MAWQHTHAYSEGAFAGGTSLLVSIRFIIFCLLTVMRFIPLVEFGRRSLVRGGVVGKTGYLAIRFHDAN